MRSGWTRWVVAGALGLGAAGCRAPAQPSPEELDRELTRTHWPAPNPIQPAPAGTGLGGAGQPPQGPYTVGQEMAINPSWPSPFALLGRAVITQEAQAQPQGVGGAGAQGQGAQQQRGGEGRGR